MHLTLQRKKLRPRRSDMSKDCGMPGAVCKREPEAPTPGQFHPRHSFTVSTDLNCSKLKMNYVLISPGFTNGWISNR